MLLYVLQCSVVLFSGTDLDDPAYVVDEDLTVTDVSRIKDFLGLLDDRLNGDLGDDYFHFDLGQERRVYFNAAVLLGTKDFGIPDFKEVGTSVVLMTSNNVTKAVIGDDAKITAGKYYVQLAMEGAVKSAAVLPGTSDADGVTSPGGGSIIVLTDTDEVLTEIGTGTVIEGALAVRVGAELHNGKNSLVSPDNRKAGAKSTGGNNTYMYSASSVFTKAGINAKIRSSQGDVELTAFTREQMISLPGANADALPGAVAALMNIMRSEGSTVVETGRVEITAKKDVRLEAKAESYLITVDPITEKASLYSPIGAVVFFDAARHVETLLGEGSTVTAGGNVWLLSALDEKMLIVLDPVRGTEGSGLIGLAAGAKSRNIVRTVVGVNSENSWNYKAAAATSVTADGSIAVTAVLDSLNKVVTAGVYENPSASNGGAAAAVIEKNTVDAIVNTMAYLKAMASLPAITVEKAGTDANGKKKTDSRTGIILYAGAKEDILLTVEGAGSSGGRSVIGTNADVNVANTVWAHAGKEAQLFAGTEIKDEFTGEVGDTGTSGDVHIEAEDQTDALILAGGIKKAEAKTESPTVFFGYFGKKVSAKNEGILAAAKDAVEVIANESTAVESYVTGSGTAVMIAGESGVLDFRNKASAFASGYLRGGKQVNVTSESKERLINTVIVRDGAEAYGSVGSVFLVYLYNGASSGIGDGSTVQSHDVLVDAGTSETVNAYVQGTAAKGSKDLSGGSILIVMTGTETIARIGENVSVSGAYSEKAGFVTVNAVNTYNLSGVAGTDVKADRTKGGVSAAASISYNKVDASVGKNTQMKVWNLSVKADSVRTVNILTAMIGANGSVDTAGTAAIVAIGSQLNKDAYDVFYAGDSTVNLTAELIRILAIGGTSPSFNDFTEDFVPLFYVTELLEAGVAGVGETIGIENGTGEYGSLLQPEGDAVSEPDKTFYMNLDGKVTRIITRYNEWEDYVSARIEPGVVVESSGNITVSAKDTVNLYVIAGAVGSNTKESVGSGTAAVLMNGNVYADAYGTLTSDGMLEITAVVQSGSKARENLKFRGTSVLDSLTHAAAQKGISPKQEPNRTGIYALAIAGAQGAPGGRDNAAYTSVSSKVTARLHGTVKKTDRLNIRAEFGFDNVHAVSIAAATGNKDITRILALEYLDVTARSGAAMAPRAGVPGFGMGDSSAVTAAAAVNRTEVHAYIAGGINVAAEMADVNVKAETQSDADVEILSETSDSYTLDMGLVIVVNDPVNLAYIGENSISVLPQTKALNGTGSLTVRTVNVNAVLREKTDARGYLLSKGNSNHLNGLVVIGIENGKNNASSAAMNIKARGSVTIEAFSENDMTVTGRPGENYKYGLGGTVALGYISTQNMAELNAVNGVIEADDLKVLAGTDTKRVNSNVTVSVDPGGLTQDLKKAMNIAAVRNDFFNRAKIHGGERSSEMGVIIVRNDVKIYSAMDSLVKAEIHPTERERLAIGAGAAFAHLNADAAASMSYTSVIAKNIYIQNWFNVEPGNISAGFLCEDKGAIAIVTPAQDAEGILAAHLTNAEALFSGSAVAELYGCDVKAADATAVKVFAQSYAKAYMDAPKVNYNYGRIGVNLIHADASGVFKAEVVEPLNYGMLSSRDVDITVSYIAMSDAKTAMIGSAKVSKEEKSLEHNIAEAYTGTFAEAALKRLAWDEPLVHIIANGQVSAHAYVEETIFAYPNNGYDVFDIMAADTTAEIAVEQRAHFDPEKLQSAAQFGRLEIRSVLNGYPYYRDGADALKISGACAETGYPVFEEDSMKARLLPLTSNTAESAAKAVNLAYIFGPGLIYSQKEVIVAAETGLKALGGVRLSKNGVETAHRLGTKVSALVRNRTEASIGSYVMLVVTGLEGGIEVTSTDSSTAKAESLFGSEATNGPDMDKLVRAGIGTLDRLSAIECADGNLSTMSVTRSWVGKSTYLEGPRISFTTANNNWADAGFKSVEGYSAGGGYVNVVPTVVSVYCDVEIGDHTTILATQGSIDLHTHSYLESAAKANSSSTNFRLEEGLAAENFTRQSEKIRIGGGAYLEARVDVSVVIGGTVNMDAAATYMDKEVKAGGSTGARNTLIRNEQIDLEKQARLRTWYGDIALHIIAAGDNDRGMEISDQITALAHQSRKAGDRINDLQARNDITVTADINTWENSEVYAPFGNVNIKVQDGYGENNLDNGKRQITIVARAEGHSSGTIATDGRNYAWNSYTENLRVNVKHSTITGDNVNLTASREAMNILAECFVKMTSFLVNGKTSAAINELKLNTDVTIKDGSYVRGYSNVNITSKTESMDLVDQNRGISRVRASAKTTTYLINAETDAINRGSMREKISIRDSSYIYGRTISINLFGWFKGDEVDNGGSRGEEKSYFDRGDSEENVLDIEKGVILFVGSMAGAVLDIALVGNNNLQVRQIGLKSTPRVSYYNSRYNRATGTYEKNIDLEDRLIPDQVPGTLIVKRKRRVYDSWYYLFFKKECEDIYQSAVSGGALTDTTIVNRTGAALSNWKGIDLTVTADLGRFMHTDDERSVRQFRLYTDIRRAEGSYPAGGLISEVYFNAPIMGPTVTHVSAKRPEIGSGYAPGVRSSLIVYRDTSGLMRTEVTEFGVNSWSGRNTDTETELSDAGFYYSFNGMQAPWNWIEDQIAFSYTVERYAERSQNNPAAENQSALREAGSQNTASANAADNNTQTAGSNGQSETAGNQTAGNQAAGTAGNESGGSQGGLNDDIKGSGADVDSNDESDSTSALAMGGKMLPVAAAAAAGALFIIFLLLKRRKEDEEQ